MSSDESVDVRRTLSDGVGGRKQGSEGKRMGKGKSYLPEEDVALCRAWIRASENPITGSEQKAETFWRSVYARFCGYGPEDASKAEGTWNDRNVNALRHHWAQISREVGKFGGIYQRVIAAHPSGKNDEDLIKDALQVYADLRSDEGSPKKEKFLFQIGRAHV